MQNHQEEEAQIATDAGSLMIEQNITHVIYDDGNKN